MEPPFADYEFVYSGIVIDTPHLGHFDETVSISLDGFSPETDYAVGSVLEWVECRTVGGGRRGPGWFLGDEQYGRSKFVVEEGDEIEDRPSEQVMVLGDRAQPRDAVQNDPIHRCELLEVAPQVLAREGNSYPFAGNLFAGFECLERKFLFVTFECLSWSPVD
jgi:hypothetical protein